MSGMISQNTKRSKAYLEMMRIFAIILVVFCHTGVYSDGLGLGLGNPAGWVHAVECLLARSAVPLFFMISGSLLLGRRESIAQVWRRRVLRIAVAIAAIWLVQYAFVCFKGDTQFGVRTYFAAVLKVDNGIMRKAGFSVVWYLYVYLFLMMLLPLLRVMAQGMRNRHYICLLAFQVAACGLVPFVYACATGTYYQFSYPLVSPDDVLYGAFFMLMGYFVETRCARTLSLPHPFLLMLSAAALCTVCAVVLMQGCVERNMPMMTTWAASACMSTIPSIALFVVFRHVGVKINTGCRLHKVLCCMGGSVFFVMLTENMWRQCLAPWFPHDGWSLSADAVAWCHSCCTVLCAMAVGIVLRLLPGFRRIL